jgi:hypothetical protein
MGNKIKYLFFIWIILFPGGVLSSGKKDSNTGKTIKVWLTGDSTVAEFKNFGPGADQVNRVKWLHQLTEEKAENYTPGNILGECVLNTELFISKD